MRPGCSRRRCAAGLVLTALLSAACATITSRTADDLSTTTQVKIALLADPILGPLRLEVVTAQGMVTLSGKVTSQAEADAAVAVARKVKGVRTVTSDLKVEKSEPQPLPSGDGVAVRAATSR